jgi:amino acid adenylation domain-containing protein/non-ribosomal peptide synthase protein (TIGR01720 family)
MIEDSGIGLLLVQPHLLDRLPVPEHVASILLETDKSSDAVENPNVSVDPANLAYVIYTSGSTGKPKGALLAHQNVVRLFDATESWFHFDDQDVWTLFHSYAFDFSVWEIFGALLHGGRLVIVPQETSRSPEDFHRLLCEERVTVLNQTPSAFKPLMAVACAGSQANHLRYVVFGGEALEVKALKPWFERFGDSAPQLVNMYGITETTVHVTYRPLSLADLQLSASSPIGEPIPDLSWYLLDSDLNPVPRGCVGELYIGREGLARGYLNRSDLSATRFVPDPFDDQGGRLYRTGDLARYHADGLIEYIGRIDQQVKIRGFRIELGEIEARLLAQPEVREVAVLAQDGAGGPQLVAYLVASQGAVPAEDQAALRATIKEGLKEHLPDYMVPAHVLFLEQLPLTANGKLDRKALPAADASLLQHSFVAPQSPLEQQIAAIWQEVLQLEQVGLTDNFFELGGDSIVSIQVVGRARQAGIRFTPKDLFQHQTVQGLATVAQALDEVPSIDQGPVRGALPLLPVQQWFFQQPVPERQQWNQSVMLTLQTPLGGAQVEQALRILVGHHDALRLAFIEGPSGWRAEHRDLEEMDRLWRDAPLLWSATLESPAELEALGNKAQASLDLGSGQLLRAVLVNLADGSQRLLLAIHHLVVDGVSWRILLEDLQSVLQQLLQQQPVSLPVKTSALQAWGERLQAHAGSAAMAEELGYWQQQLQDVALDIPCDQPQGGQQNRHAHTVYTTLGADLTRQLLQQAPAAYRTQVNDLLLAAFARVIGRWTGHANTLIQLEGHGREELFDDLDLTRSVGWFTSIFPLKLSAATDLDASIKRVKEQLRAIPNKGIGFALLRYLGPPAVQQTLAALAIPRITFNYLGQFDGSFATQQEALFVPSGEPKGLEQSLDAPLDNWLSINGQVYGGELSLGWTFSRERYQPATIQRLADDYAEELRQLIEHCCQPRTCGLTPSDFPLAQLTQAQLDALPVDPRQVEDLYPLSPMQQGMLFHSLYNQGSGEYINQLQVDVEGLEVERFRQAWQACIDGHDILRSGFLWQGELEHPLQVVQRQATLPWVLHDWRDRPHTPEDLQALADAERQAPFDLVQSPLLRLVLVRTGERRHSLIYTSHHILMDGWSNSQLLGEVLQRYRGQSLTKQPGRYRDYIAWLQRQDPQASEDFWKTQLNPLHEPTLLAQATLRDKAQAEVGGQGIHQQWLDAESTTALGEFARQHKVTVNTLVQAAWLLLLQRYSGQDCVVFGATVAGRPADLPGVEQQIGLFINTLPVIASPRPEQSLVPWLQSLQAQNLALREFEHTPLFDIQRWAGRSGEALFDTLLVFENYPISQALEQGASQDLRFDLPESREQTNYPLSIAVGLEARLFLQMGYDRSHFDTATIERLSRHFIGLLQQLPASSANTRLGSLELSDAMPRAAVPAAPRYSTDLCVHQLIAAQARATPEATALIFGDRQLSYRELDGRANHLAQTLVAAGVGPEVLVAIAAQRGLEMLVGLLAILKAGGAYVPLDPQYPSERLAYMLQDSGAGLLLTQASLLPDLSVPEGLRTLLLEPVTEHDPLLDHAPQVALAPQSLAYVIYTSGSTGQPKGVAVAHGPLAMHCLSTGERYGMSAADRELHFLSFAFDGAHERWLTSLVMGGSLLLRDDSLWLPERTYEEIRRHGVSMAGFPPAYLQQLAEHAERVGNPPPVRLYSYGGDAMPSASFDKIQRALRPQFMINGYGPTETVVTPLVWKTQAADRCTTAYAPIGTCVGDRQAYVLDASLSRLPSGISGELYLGGVGLARGYLNRAAATAERFVPDPFTSGGGRLYRTGDLVREDEHEVYEYLGRIDNQVKIRGFRIELGEVEACLLQAPDVREAVVLAQPGHSGLQLVAYVVPGASSAGSEAAAEDLYKVRLSEHLRASLPAYMVPARLLVLERLPLLPNGKLDRKALPAADVGGQQQYVAPQGELEQQVAAIWAQVLKLERVGREDNFFELGGHSLSVIMVVAQIKSRLGLEVGVHEVMYQPCLAQFCAALEQSAGIKSLVVQLGQGPQDAGSLFCIHPGSGSAYAYFPLAMALRDLVTVQGLMFRDYIHADAGEQSWDEMVNEYTEQIRRCQPEGPYRLLGWSLGGTIAQSVASRLEAQGAEVSFLGLLDPTPPDIAFVEAPASAAVQEVLSEGHSLEKMLKYFRVFFPQYTDAADAYMEANAACLDADFSRSAFIGWAAEVTGHELAAIEELMANTEVEDEVSVARNIFVRLGRMLREFNYPSLHVPASCWWPTLEASMADVAKMEQTLRRYSRSGELKCSVLVQSDHNKLAFAPDFIQSLRAHLGADIQAG